MCWNLFQLQELKDLKPERTWKLLVSAFHFQRASQTETATSLRETATSLRETAPSLRETAALEDVQQI